MAKMSLDANKLKSFFGLHVEKMVLGLVFVLLFVFVYLGYSLEGLQQTPSELETLTTAAVTKMGENTWKNIEEENRPETEHAAKVKLGDSPTPEALYAAEKPLKPVGRNLGEKRKDPQLLPPTKLEVYAVSGPVAYRMTVDDTDPLADAKASDLKKKDTKAAAKKPAKKTRGPYGGDYPAPGMDPGGSIGGGPGGMGPMGPGMSPMGPGMMPGSESPYGTMGTGVLANGQRIPGFRAGQGAIAKPRNIVSVRAVVEVQKQWDEYERAFSTAVGYVPSRDVPSYVMFLAQRADVTDDPNRTLTDADWKNIANNESVRAELMKEPWYGIAQDVVDQRYRSQVLTMPIPPLMMRDLDPLALHSLTPRQKITAQMIAAMDRDKKKKKSGEGKDKEGEADSTEGDEATVSDAPSTMMSGAGMGGSPYGMGGSPYGAGGSPYGAGGSPYGAGGSPYGSEAGMGPGMPGMPGMPSMPGMPGMPGMPSMPGMGLGSEMGMGAESPYGPGMMPGMPGMGMGSEMGMGPESAYGGPGMGPGMYGAYGMSGSMMRGPQVEYALVRFFDLNAEVGHKYRYRIAVFLEDPNHPRMATMEPNERTLDDSVKTRLADVIKEEKEKNSRVFYVRSDWSVPSDVVAVSPDPIALAGEIETFRPVAVPQSSQTIAANEPKGSVMSVVWDETRAVDVPAEVDAYRGSVMNFKETADVIHPVTLQYKELENFDFLTDLTIVDMRGGEELPGTSTDTEKTPLAVLGQYLVLTRSGELQVRDELDDYDEFQLYTPPVVKEAASATYPGMEGPGGMYGPGGPSYGGPSGEGDTGRRRRGR